MTIKMKSVFTILFPLIALVQIPVINCANIMKITPTDVDSGLSDSLFNLCLKLQDSHVNVNDNKTIRNNFVVSPLGFGLALGQISLGANTQLRNHIYDFMQWNSGKFYNRAQVRILCVYTIANLFLLLIFYL